MIHFAGRQRPGAPFSRHCQFSWMISCDWFSHMNGLSEYTTTKLCLFRNMSLTRTAVLGLKWLVLYLLMQVPIWLWAKNTFPSWENIAAISWPPNKFLVFDEAEPLKKMTIILCKVTGLTSNGRLRFQFCKVNRKNEQALCIEIVAKFPLLIQPHLGAWLK